MKKKLKKLLSIILTALFICTILPVGVFAATPPESEIEPQDSGGFIYQYYNDCPTGWPEAVAEQNGWSGSRQDEMLVLAKYVRMYAVNELRNELIRYCPFLNVADRFVAKQIAKKIINHAISAGSNAMNISLSVTYLRNDNRRPYQYLYYYSYSYSFAGLSGAGNVYELATLN